MNTHVYQITTTWNRDRRGMMCSPELKTGGAQNGCLEVATPPEFPHGIPGIWSPEHLFTAAVSSCFMTTFLAIAENSKLQFTAFHCNAGGRLDKVNGGLQMSEVVLEPILTIPETEDPDKAMQVLLKTEKGCLITKSIRSTVTVNPLIEIAEPVHG